MVKYLETMCLGFWLVTEGIGRGNMFLPIHESLKPCTWHNPLCSGRPDLSRIWSIALNLGFKEHLKALTAACASVTSPHQ